MTSLARTSAIPIVALDVASVGDAMALVNRLGESCRYYKVGCELFTAAGPHVVQAIRELGHEVFLDLKLHDIPKSMKVRAPAVAVKAIVARVR